MHALTITHKLFHCINLRDEFECDCSQKRSIQAVLNWSRLLVPRQTRYNWRHAAAESDDRGSEDNGESCTDEGCDEIEDNMELIESEAEDNNDPI